MTFRMPSRLTLLTVALLLMLPALAVLQYRWMGQISDAERERMQRTMRHAAEQFRAAFDGEIGRAFMHLHVDRATVRDEAWDRYAERYATWAGTTEYSAIVASVFLIDADRSALRLRRWNSQARRFEQAEWEGALAASRDHFTSALQAFTAGDPLPAHQMQPRAGDEVLLIAPLMTMQFGPGGQNRMHTTATATFGFTVIQLNLPFIRDRLVPALARRHFTHTDGAGYRVAVVDARDSGKVIYRSSPEAPTDPARADLSEPLFSAHGDPIMFFARPGAMREARETRNLLVSVIREKGKTLTRTRMFDQEIGRWRLLIQDDRGSLDAAVAGVRQRNLIISFGILLLMGGSVGLLSVSSRRAQRLARQQMEFVAGVSHELRTPVAVIRSAAENLSQGVVGDPDRVRRYGSAIEGEARRLGEMVERVLQFAGIESGRGIARSPVAIAPLVDEAIDAAAAQSFTIERHIAPDLPPVAGDAAALRSAIQNLIANAMKYGGADRWIGIRAEAGFTARGREVRVTVQDHGHGIAARDLPHIFDPFYRGADVVARQIQGSGLGLALVRRIAEAHGGAVDVTTTAGEGSAFTLHLPAANAAPDPVAYPSPNEAVAR